MVIRQSNTCESFPKPNLERMQWPNGSRNKSGNWPEFLPRGLLTPMSLKRRMT